MAKNGTKQEMGQKRQHFEGKNCHFGALSPKSPFSPKFAKKANLKGLGV